MDTNSQTEITIQPLRVYDAYETSKILRLEAINPRVAVNKLCKRKKIKAQLPSRKQGYRILGQAILDYLMVKGG